MKIACIGTGAMGGAIMRAVCKKYNAGDITVTDKNSEMGKKFAEETGAVFAGSNEDAIKGADYIFIDTSGFSPNDYDNIAKMRNILNLQGFSLDTYLVVAASTKARDLKKTIENFSLFNFNSVIITKCDETTSYGNVLSVLYESNRTIAYITDGQKVPNDIKKASVREFLYRLSDFTVSKVYIDDMFPEDE